MKNKYGTGPCKKKPLCRQGPLSYNEYYILKYHCKNDLPPCKPPPWYTTPCNDPCPPHCPCGPPPCPPPPCPPPPCHCGPPPCPPPPCHCGPPPCPPPPCHCGPPPCHGGHPFH